MDMLSKDNITMLMAGAAKMNITPPPGTFINGDFVTHYAQYMHDDLYSKAIVLKQAGITIAIVVVDICVMAKEFVDNVKTEISNQTKIPFKNILVASTHTHAAGSVASVYLASADLLYSKKTTRFNCTISYSGYAKPSCRQNSFWKRRCSRACTFQTLLYAGSL